MVRMLKFETIPTSAVTMVPKMSDEAIKGIMLDLSEDDKKDSTSWVDTGAF